MPRYFEDIDVGQTHDLGRVTVTEEEIVAFGEQWDPLPQHTDSVAAEESLPGELIASGYHTLCLSNQLAAERVRGDLARSIGLGIEDVRWPAPVTPGDEVRFRHEVVETRVSESDPSYGVVASRITAEVEEKGLVLEYHTTALIERRGDGSS